METMFALDFVSLLLSKQAPRQAETSMSPFLKQIAPLGSLSAEVVNPPPKPESTTKDISAVSRGWRVQNFNGAANKLLQAASRLDTEVTSETRYWNEVLAVKNKGWKISRLPRERQALGVQYGFLEGEARSIGNWAWLDTSNRTTQLPRLSATADLPLCAELRMAVFC